MASNVPPHHISLPSGHVLVQPLDSAWTGATDKSNDKFFCAN